MKKLFPCLLRYCIVSIIFLATFIPANSQTKLVGVLDFGGDQFGSVYSMTTAGTNFTINHLKGNSGKDIKCDLTPPVNGKSYGMTHAGGIYNGGVIFEYDYTTNTYTKKYDFPITASPNGNSPVGSLVLASNGKLYGMTDQGGTTGGGVIFEFNLVNNTYTKKIDLVYATGIFPAGTLTEASNGKLYGMATSGGAGFWGVLFEYDYNSNTYTKKVDFNVTNGDPDGLNYSLTEAPNGKLYGTTRMGGLGQGTIFEFDYVSGAFTKKMDFDQSVAGGVMGIFPTGGLKLAPNGELYGMTSSGGSANKGVIFEYDYIDNIYKKRVDLATTDASSPEGSLLLTTNGKFYGVTPIGGSANTGVLFEYDYNSNVYTKKLDFTSTTAYSPHSSLIQTPDGKIYGMANAGGLTLNGVIFQYDNITNAYTIKQNFFYAQEGSHPTGSLTMGADGKLYGVTIEGGINGHGVIFEYNHVNNTYTRRMELGPMPGSNYSNLNSLVLASNGKMYGTYFGASNSGVLYEYDYSTNIYTNRFNFSQPLGERPFGHMLQASNGKLYGTTQMSGPGSNSQGVIYEYDYSNNSYIVKHTFYGTNGSDASFPLMQASNGKIYGIAHQGGANGKGVLYEFDYTSNSYTMKYAFGQASDGSYPWGGVIQANNGKLYGFFSESGTTTNGGIYEYDYNSNTYTRKLTFADTLNGLHPSGELLQGSNGKLYGTMAGGGAYKRGAAFEYDYNTNTYSIIRSFTAIESVPYSTQLIEVPDPGCIPATQPVLAAVNTIVCDNNPVILSVQSGQLNSSSSWKWYSGSCGGTFIGTGISITVNPTVTTTYFARGEGECGGLGSCGSITITVAALPATPAPVLGINNVCSYVGTGTTLTYSVSPDPNAAVYLWTVPSTVSIISGQGTNSIIVTINNGFIENANKLIKVSASSACGTSAERLLYLSAQLPSTPGLIAASGTNVCASMGNNIPITYTILKVAGASSYNWSAQTGTTSIFHPNGPGINDTTVTLTFTNSFSTSYISVQAVNNCGTSGTRSLTITRNNPSAPGLISGPTNACAFIAPNGVAALYTVPNIPGNTYNWTIPAGATAFIGQGTNSISFIFPAGFTNGSVTVTATNACGTSPVRSLSISKLNPSTPGGITVVQTQACPDRVYTYSIPSLPSNATSIVWTLPAGASQVGATSTSISVAYPPGNINGTVTAQSISNCAVSAIRSINVVLPLCNPEERPLVSKPINQKPQVFANNNMEVIVFPNPSINDFQLQVITAVRQVVNLSISDMQGREIKKLSILTGEPIYFGKDLRAGVYMIEVRQGSNRKVIRVIKL